MKKISSIVFILFSLSLPFPLMAAIEKLLQEDRSWDGQTFSYLQGKPEITSVKLNLKVGVKAPFHCHPVPTMGYIAKGEVMLENYEGESIKFKQGDSVIEIMKGLHRGYAVNSDAQIIVFYAGIKNVPNTVFPTDKVNFSRYCE